MNNTRFPLIFGICASLLLLAGCATLTKTPTPLAATTAPTATSKPLPAPTSTPTWNPQPTFTPAPPPSTPAATRIACNLDSPYLGVSQPGKALYVLDLQDGCIARIAPSHSDKVYGWGSWLPDGSGFVYLDGNRDGTSINVCVWDLVRQTTTRCLLEAVSNYMQAVWSPGDTNLVAYRRSDAARKREFVTVASARSGEVLYENEQSLLSNSNEERFLAWHPDGKRILLAVDDGLEQQAVLVDVVSPSRQVLAKFDGSNEYLATGQWLDNGESVLLSTIEPDMCCNAEFVPAARNIYRVNADGSGFKALVVDLDIAFYLYASVRRQLLIKTFGTELSPIYWLDLRSGELTRVFDDEFEKRYLRPLGITPDNKYIVMSDGQYQTWVFDTRTRQLTKSALEIYDTIEWRH